MIHSLSTFNHPIENWVFPSAVQRIAPGAYVSQDIGKIAYQIDNATYWRLTGTSPTWSALSTAGSQPVSTKNYIVNGAMMVSQENGATPGTAGGYYPVDQFAVIFATSGALSSAQVASATPSGSPNRIRLTVTTADSTITAGEVLHVRYRLEGLRVADLRFGTTAAKTITLQFGVKAPAGTYCVVFCNAAAATRSYVAEYVIAAAEANTDVIKSITIPGDTTGTWPKDNTQGMELRFALMCGTTYQQAAGSWSTGDVVASPNQFNFMGTVGNVFELFDVGLYQGSAAPTFQVPDFASELAACRRYFWRRTFANNQMVAAVQAYSTTAAAGFMFLLPVEMRAAPAATMSAVGHFNFQLATGGGNPATGLNLASTADSLWLSSSTGTGLVGGNATALYANTAAAWMAFNSRM